MTPRLTAIVGGGPAGATTAERLARDAALDRAGQGKARVMVFEERRGWEKPCGGALTHKALRRYPFLLETAGGGKHVYNAEFIAPNGASIRWRLRQPVAIYSRCTLNQLLLHRAEEAGAEVIQDRILDLRRVGSVWELQGRARSYRADYLVLAAGARSRLRRLLTEEFTSRDFMLTLGYYVPSRDDLLRVQFFEDFEGYAWGFPRPDHLSVGICGKVGQDRMIGLRERLRGFMQRFGYQAEDSALYSHVLPSLSVESWNNLRLEGTGWAMAGDAAGLVDSITGEGIYYAMRSGELLAEALMEGSPALYPERVRDEFGRTLALGARLARLFYHGDFLGGPVTTRMVEFGARSRKFLQVLQDLIEGSQSYQGLTARLYLGLTRTLFEVAGNLVREALHRPQAA